MATINSLTRAQSLGIPEQFTEEILVTNLALITGNEPAVLTVDHPVAAGVTFAALTVVGLDASGNVVKAVKGTVNAVGIAVAPLATAGTAGALKGAPIYRAGCFNPDALIWDASYATDADKFAAFNLAPQPTQIVVRRPKTATVA